VNIDTQHGHDGFLLESVQVGRALAAFIDRV
jgi:homoserine acetyltransferase